MRKWQLNIGISKRRGGKQERYKKGRIGEGRHGNIGIKVHTFCDLVWAVVWVLMVLQPDVI